MGLFGLSRGSVEYRVPAMNCGHCEAKITGAVRGVAGVKKARASAPEKRLVLEYRGDTAPDLAAVNAVLKPLGFEAQPVQEQ
ncbi:Copper chaperone CopZ [Alkalispirochaeta americana]|uniref:Copper chaperone CopZ n=1 Tax=Alkalispirochaeta americana TaxID=159291 RepID=A0A1N6QHS6_9SPIO|nr:heavy-metal-associated domain-containing protein [Alkalispirochaeta americana]SIQ16128.1 Copper chaperone CopZ [Alkalispirochaeta americana]